ncbi:hypothetical protein HPB52_008921 [Rhipicephalus sanguineus]|uniref:Uncharacterized protein n=1 Tax=Rhipicephalus sanguineus TaxID=34632 RepID=A0A9D4PYV9_RHISA|nr:hypothetical protein HPB52_008921 [Rhipicephalus sanguineus]
MAEIRRGKGELSSLADKQIAESVPTEIPVVAACDAERPAKKRAIGGEQETMASRAKFCKSYDIAVAKLEEVS